MGVNWARDRISSSVKNFSKNKECLLNGDFSKIGIIVDSHEIPLLKQNQIYPLYNQDYQKYKKTFNKGLNFRIFSKDKTNERIHKGFYVLKVPEDKATQEYFRVEL